MVSRQTFSGNDMGVEEKLEGCIWNRSLEHEKRNFSADSAVYRIITKKEESRIYRECGGCDGLRMQCPNYLPIRERGSLINPPS